MTDTQISDSKDKEENKDDATQPNVEGSVEIKDDGAQENTEKKVEIKDDTAPQNEKEENGIDDLILEDLDDNVIEGDSQVLENAEEVADDIEKLEAEGKFDIKDVTEDLDLKDFTDLETLEATQDKVAPTYDDDYIKVEEPPPPVTMRIPHTIPEEALRAYEPSAEARALRGGEEGRSIQAEHFGWDACVPQPLGYWCVLAIVHNFADNPLLNELPPGDRDHVLEKLPTNLELELSVPLLPDGVYWRRCCEERWETNNYVSNYGNSWKRMYLERYLEEFLEELPVEDYRVDKVSGLGKLLEPYVLRLRLRQLQLTRPQSDLDAAALAAEMLVEEVTDAALDLEVDIVPVARAPLPPEPEERKSVAGRIYHKIV